MLKIGDFSRLAQVSTRTLRLYDDLGLLQPAHVDTFTEYRYYRLEQLPVINRIIALKDMGFSLDEIRPMLTRALPVAELEAMLARKRIEIESRVREEQDRLAQVSTRLAQIAREGQPPLYDVVVKPLPQMRIGGVRQTVPDYSQMGRTRGELLHALYANLAQMRLPDSGVELVLYHNTEYRETDVHVEFAMTLPLSAALTAEDTPLFVRDLPEVEMAATLIHHGEPWGIPTALVELFRWIAISGHQSAGSIRELHLGGSERNVTELHHSITVELQVPIAPAHEFPS
jgi:DNA-binding transcriptional MerR regulator